MNKKLHLFDFLLPMSSEEPVEKGFMLLEGNRILETGSSTSIEESFKENYEVVEHDNSLVLPGLINAHSHLSYATCYKPPQPGDQINWIKTLVQISRPTTSDQRREILKENIASVLSSGTTFIVENTPFQEALEALNNTSLKSLVGLEVFGNSRTEEVFESSINSFNQSVKQFPNLDLTLSPHSLYNVNPDLMSLCIEWSKNNNKKLLTHLAEFDFESRILAGQDLDDPQYEIFFKSLGQIKPKYSSSTTPIALAEQIKLLNPLTLATHMIRIADEELNLVAESGVQVVLCPRSNSFLFNGLPKAEKMLKVGINFSIATDGVSSNQDFDLLNEIKAAKLLFASQGQNISAKSLFQAITINPAVQLGKQNEIGSLEKGKLADFGVYNLSESEKQQLSKLKGEEFYFYLLNIINSARLNSLWINGKICLSNANHKLQSTL
jgi:cytosine/adenosine deaminase-related metal-dependent hydrolase